MKRFCTFLLLALLAACSADDSDTPMLQTIQIVSSNGTRLDIGETTQLTVEAFDQFNNTLTLNEEIAWLSSNEHVTVNQQGLATGVSVGNATITASVGNIQASISITVWDSSAPRTEIYVSDAGTGTNPKYQILKFDEDGSNPEVFTTQNLAWPQDILFLESEGTVLISNLNSSSIGRYHIETGNFIDNFATGINGPTRMKIGPDNLLYVLQWQGSGEVLRYQLDGTFIDTFTNVGVFNAIGLDWDTAGNLYVSSWNNGTAGFVRKFNAAGEDQGLFINTNLQGPTNIWFTTDGDLMVNDWTAGLVARFDNEGNFIENAIIGLNKPEGVALFGNGRFLIGNGGTGSVKLYGSNNSYIQDLIPSRSGNLANPNAVVLRHVN
jgi:hypothetical protein